MTETRAKVFGVIGKGLVTSSLCPQDMLLNCTTDPVSSTVCLCFLVVFFFLFLNASNSLFSLSTVKQLIVNSEQIHIVGVDCSGDRGTVCHRLLFGKADLL